MNYLATFCGRGGGGRLQRELSCVDDGATVMSSELSGNLLRGRGEGGGWRGN